MSRKFFFTVGILVVFAVAGIVFVTPFILGIISIPTDIRIISILKENEKNLLSIEGVVGAGIARNESNNYIIGIAVYVDDGVTAPQKIPSKLGEFKVFIKKIGEASEFEMERMIINPRYRLLNVTTDKIVYLQNDNITIIVKNLSNETVIFGNSAYELFFKKWNGDSWEVYTGVIGLEVITYLKPEETAEIEYKLGGQTDKPFPPGKYRVISEGWIDHNGKIVYVWGYAEFTVE